MMFSLRTWTIDDMFAMLDMYEEFFAETNFAGKLTFNKFKVYDFLRSILPNPSCECFIVEADGQPAGFGMVTWTDYDTDEPVGELYKFYVRPAYRGTKAARLLRDACDKQFEKWGCAASYVECGAGLDEHRNNMLFSNLWKRLGYSFLGTALIKFHRR